MALLVDSFDGRTEEPIKVAERDGVALGNFRLIGKGQHADLCFRWYDNGPHEAVFPMTGGWPTEAEADRVIEAAYAQEGHCG